jgi:transcriptional regulator with XRE-family HTH domain
MREVTVPGDRPYSLEYERARLQQQVVGAIAWQMSRQRLTKQELAARMGVSPGRVSQVLSGDENLTLKTLASAASALGAHFDISLRAATRTVLPLPPTKRHWRSIHTPRLPLRSDLLRPQRTRVGWWDPEEASRCGALLARAAPPLLRSALFLRLHDALQLIPQSSIICKA